MTTQSIHKKPLKEAAIILLIPPYGRESNDLAQNLRRACRNSGWTFIKEIQTRSNTDYPALYKLTRRIATLRKPVNIILDKKFLDCPENILACCCLGTLYESRLINLHTYEAENAGTELQPLPKPESGLLYKSAIYFSENFEYRGDQIKIMRENIRF